jgi:hypothetical protein
MGRRTPLSRAAFGAATAGVLAFGASAAAAGPAEARALVSCPGYTNTAQICDDCCWNNWQAYGGWDPGSRYCNCYL